MPAFRAEFQADKSFKIKFPQRKSFIQVGSTSSKDFTSKQ